MKKSLLTFIHRIRFFIKLASPVSKFLFKLTLQVRYGRTGKNTVFSVPRTKPTQRLCGSSL